VKYATLSVTALSAVLLVACASAPKRMEQLEQARVDVQTLSQDPSAEQAASSELRAARGSLDQADAAMKKGDKEDAIHYAYLASQQAQTGKSRVEEARAREQVAQGEADRTRVLLEARTTEAERAAAQARAATAVAQAQTQQADAARQEAVAARAEAESMQQQLAELQAKQTERGMVLTLGDVLFDTNTATLKPGATVALERVAEFMKQNASTKVMIEGHTDSRGSDSYNMELSQRRAQAVGDALAFRGVDRGRVEAVGRGEGFPVATNDSGAGRQQNRRVEIVFSDESGRFAAGANNALR